MPWLLCPELRVRPFADGYRLENPFEWRLPPGRRMPFALTSPDCAPKPEDLQTTFSFALDDDRDPVPDFGRGPVESSIIVSREFRELVEAMDPVSHYYMPLRVLLPAGRALDGTHFLFKLGGFIEEGIIAGESDVAPQYMSGRFLGLYLARGGTPRLSWRGSTVRGRHIWADKYMPSYNVVSDALYTEMKRRNMITFVTKESRVDPAR